MPKTLTQSQVLGEKIKTLEEAIADKERELVEQREEASQLSEALRLLSTGVAYHVPEGRVKMLDVINGLLDESSDQEDRAFRWSVAQKALAVGQEVVFNIDAELQELRQQLAIAIDELDWVSNYQPVVAKYSDGFTMLSPEQRKQERVHAMQADIAQRQAQLQRAQSWLAQPEGDRSYYPGDAMREAEWLNRSIPTLTQQLQRLISEPVVKDAKYESAFREYVRARTKVQPMLEALLTAQDEYLIALREFKMAIAANPEACQFPIAALSEPRLVSDDDGIRLVDVAPEPVSKRLW